ncbi:uncharacterized protein LOC133714751 [Rosa rugosa]|uniref:uncharacterized protein LOC133714751 n=1 Tax=Rosa rugosa TaxID=74645 RepID=UPI002B40F8A3|nr:uncharacterized protein LOC133714751 [Rosa rugosa]
MALLVRSPEISIVFSNPNPNPNRKGFRFPTNFGSKSRSTVRVCAGVKDSAARASELDRNLRSHGQFSAPVKQGPKPSKEDQEKQEYYVNMGYAIRTVREEFPELFFRELSLDIYRDDITFKDPINTFMGIENYKSIFSALRFHGQIFFKALWVDVISVSQPMDNVIMVRWTIHGMPRVPWESRGRFDGTSEYKLDKKGKIYEHRVDNIALNSPPKFQILAVGDIMQSLGCPSTPKPTFFETSSLPSSKRS